MRERLLKIFTHRAVLSGFLAACFIGALGQGVMGLGCSGWDPKKPFERENPDVNRALDMVEDGQFENAEEVLTEYLDIEGCKEAKINLPKNLAQRSDGTFDLGLVLFHLAEKFGERFGDEKKLLEKIDAGEGLEQLAETAQKRSNQVECGLIVSLGIAKDSRVPAELRARAYYLAGNLNFLRMDYEKAIGAYEEALKLVPGVAEDSGGDGIGRDASWNRAVALRRLEEMRPDAGADGAAPQQDPQDPDGGQDQDGGDPNQQDGDVDGGGQDGGEPDAGEDAGPDAGGGAEDAGPDGGQDQDGGDDKPEDGQEPNEDPKPAEPDGRAPGGDQGDRILERFEGMDTYQQEDAKKRNERPRRQLEDK